MGTRLTLAMLAIALGAAAIARADGTLWYLGGAGLEMQLSGITEPQAWRNGDGWVEPIGAMVCKFKPVKVKPGATPVPYRPDPPRALVHNGDHIGFWGRTPKDFASLDCERLPDPMRTPWWEPTPTPSPRR